MKGLLLKDFYVTMKCCKMYFLIDLIFIALSFISNDSFMFLLYPVLMSGVLGISLLSFDEKFKWVKYSGALPYSSAQMVLSKYIFGLVIQVLTTLEVFLALIIRVNVMDGITFYEAALSLGGMFVFSLMIPSFSLPFCFKFGTEKGRIFYFVFVFAMAALLLRSADKLERFIKTNYLVLIVTAAIIVIYALSLIISIALYSKREITS